MTVAALYDVPAPAKLNAYLHVVGRRADGLHLIESLMVLLDWADTLHFEPRSDGRLSRLDTAERLPEEDLCLRAARALQAASATTQGADITIDKRVPAGAGLGGGSSDAATTLLALNRLWRLDWPLAKLLPIGLGLGADVPFFLHGTNAVARGVGEQLTPAAVAAAWFAVVKPAAGLATGAVFARFAATPRGTAARILGFSEAIPETRGEVDERNDLQASAVDLCPDVARAAALLQRAFGNSRLTGSGSAVFARAGAGAAPAAAMPSDVPAGWPARMCRSLGQHPLAGWAETG